MADNQAAPADAAIEFLKQHENVWSNWVSKDAAKKNQKFTIVISEITEPVL
jgi:ABC-type proline/glycine betaine transport system substrate-binding protein